MRRAWWIAGAVALGLTGCFGRQAEPASPAEAAAALVGHGPGYEALHQAAMLPQRHALRVEETGLAGVSLGASAEQVRAKLGAPSRSEKRPEGTWWIYDDDDARLRSGGRLRLLLAGEPAALAQIQAWAPSRLETLTMVRPLDPASRLERKYGAPFRKLPWKGGAEAWLYPASNVAYVVTAPDGEERRHVAAVIVGL